jgi:uncharacterized protein (TIGR03086 family)
MDTHTDPFLQLADRFTEVLDEAGAADWSAASPCEGWTAGAVVEHVVDTQRDFLLQHGADLGDRPSGAPDRVWAAHHDAARRALADGTLAATEYDGWFGRTTVGDSLARFYGFDLLVHGWDVARALGRDVTFTDAELDTLEDAMAGFGDALYTEGVCKPALDVPDDAPRQTRVLARTGRAA